MAAMKGDHQHPSSLQAYLAALTCWALTRKNKKLNGLCIVHDGTTYSRYATTAHATMDPTLHYNVTTEKLMSNYFHQ